MIPVAKQEFCPHAFSYGYCPQGCILIRSHVEVAREKRRQLLRLFKRRDWKNPVTKASIIEKLHQIRREECYVTLPQNMIIKV